MTSAEGLLIQTKKIQQVLKHPDEMAFIGMSKEKRCREEVQSPHEAHGLIFCRITGPSTRTWEEDVGNRIVSANVRTIVT